MSTRVARVAAVAAVVIAAVAVAVAVVASRGDAPYRLRVVLDNASGLRAGSDVRIGDVTAGTVSSIGLGAGDRVVAELELDRDQAPVGADASVAIASLNLLGQKYVALDKGDVATPARAGFTIPASRITSSTDLDQVLGVLDAETRTRLAILINEAGYAVTGRRADFNALLGELPHTTRAATKLLEQLANDNRTLALLVDHSDRFVAQVTRERRTLAALIGTAGQAVVTVGARRAQLRETLARAPRALGTLRAFLADLRATTKPLGPAAGDVAASAPQVTRALAELEPFRHAAAPALAQARSLAPALTRLAAAATPVLRRANSTAGSLATFGRTLVPVSDTLDDSADNLIAIAENWSRAIQFRDAFSHIFNAQLAISPDVLLTLVRRLQRLDAASKRAERPQRGPKSPKRALPHVPAPSGDGRPPNATPPAVSGPVGKLLDGLLSHLPGSSAPPESGSGVTSDLLDYLLKP